MKRPQKMKLVRSPREMKLVETFGIPQEMQIVLCRHQGKKIVACRPSPMTTCQTKNQKRMGGSSKYFGATSLLPKT
jgi:hypothetical protein